MRNPRSTSGRDEMHNIIVYWPQIPPNQPYDGSSCWIYFADYQLWVSGDDPDFRRTPPNLAAAPEPTIIDITGLDDPPDPLPGQWLYMKLNEEALYGHMVLTTAPDNEMLTALGCLTLPPDETARPLVRITYPSNLPLELLQSAEYPRVQTTIQSQIVPLTWEPSLTQTDSIKLTDRDAQILVNHIGYAEAESFNLTFQEYPHLSRTIPTPNLWLAVSEAELWCLTEITEEQEVQQLLPPQDVQTPADGMYRYTSTEGRFSFKYPADCGQMWESQDFADNFDTCPGHLTDINTSVSTINLKGVGEQVATSTAWLAKDFADNLALRSQDAIQYTLMTETGLKLQVVKANYAETEEQYPTTLTAAVYADAEWEVITIYMAYLTSTSDMNDLRAEQALRTLTAKNP